MSTVPNTPSPTKTRRGTVRQPALSPKARTKQSRAESQVAIEPPAKKASLATDAGDGPASNTRRGQGTARRAAGRKITGRGRNTLGRGAAGATVPVVSTTWFLFFSIIYFILLTFLLAPNR